MTSSDDQSSESKKVNRVDRGFIVDGGSTFNGGQAIFNFGDQVQPAASPPAAEQKPRADIFISYRRAASRDFAGRLYEALSQRVDGRVFLDVEGLGVGKFSDALLEEIRRCAVFALVIGPGTFDRIHEDGDWVHEEIRHALTLQRTLVLVLSEDAVFPKAHELPPDIQAVVDYQGYHIRHASFADDVARLVRGLP